LRDVDQQMVLMKFPLMVRTDIFVWLLLLSGQNPSQDIQGTMCDNLGQQTSTAGAKQMTGRRV
jgi:hypothetical protein